MSARGQVAGTAERWSGVVGRISHVMNVWQGFEIQRVALVRVRAPHTPPGGFSGGPLLLRDRYLSCPNRFNEHFRHDKVGGPPYSSVARERGSCCGLGCDLDQRIYWALSNGVHKWFGLILLLLDAEFNLNQVYSGSPLDRFLCSSPSPLIRPSIPTAVRHSAT